MLAKFIEKVFQIFLDWFFPSPTDIARIEKMTPAAFSNEAKRTLENPPMNVHTIFRYRDPLVEKAVRTLKYKGNRKIAKLFAELLSEVMIETLSDQELFDDFTEPILIPIPLSRERLRERGWNQAEMIAREIFKLQPTLELHTDILFKIKNTDSQTKFNREKRLKNIRNCFAVKNKNLISGRNIIIVDDVVTTGSTIEEARRALLESGARRAIAFTVAH